MLLVRGQRHAGRRAGRASMAPPGRGQVVHEPALLVAAGRGRSAPVGAASVASSSSPSTAGAVPPSSRTLRALAQEPARVAGSAVRPARDEQDVVDVALGERPLPGRDLDDTTRWFCERAVARIESADAQRGEQREREQDGGDRAPAARGRERPERRAPRIASAPPARCACRRGSGRTCCRTGRSGPARGARRASASCPRRRARARPPSPLLERVLVDRDAVGAKRQARRDRRAPRSARGRRALVVDDQHDVAGAHLPDGAVMLKSRSVILSVAGPGLDPAAVGSRARPAARADA